MGLLAYATQFRRVLIIDELHGPWQCLSFFHHGPLLIQIGYVLPRYLCNGGRIGLFIVFSCPPLFSFRSCLSSRDECRVSTW